MKSEKDLPAIYNIVAELNPDRVQREVEYMSAGCKGISYERMRGPVNDEPPPPSTDPLDRIISRQHRDFKKHLAAMRQAGEKALRVQRELCTRMTLAQAQKTIEIEEGVGTCVNCGHVANGARDDRIVKERCSRACYPYFRAHGEDRPRDLVEASL